MSKKKYTIASADEARAARIAGEVGDTVELDLDEGTELAVVAAGWLERVESAPTKKKEG